MAEFLYADKTITEDLDVQNLTKISGDNTWSDYSPFTQ